MATNPRNGALHVRQIEVWSCHAFGGASAGVYQALDRCLGLCDRDSTMHMRDQAQVRSGNEECRQQ